ncbi:MAG: thioredoxin domain-containing protein [Ideonella sp.]
MIPEAPLLVACLCARWCQLCGEYRATFTEAQQRGAGRFRFIWVDIEDDEAILGPVEVDDFPTLLIANGQAPLFFGPLTPQPATLERLLQSAEAGRLAPLADLQTVELTARIRAAADQLNDAGA